MKKILLIALLFWTTDLFALRNLGLTGVTTPDVALSQSGAGTVSWVITGTGPVLPIGSLQIQISFPSNVQVSCAVNTGWSCSLAGNTINFVNTSALSGTGAALNFNYTGTVTGGPNNVSANVTQTAAGNSAGDDFVGSTVQTFGVLPVSLSVFTAVKQKSSAILNWTTQDELNTDKFIVERSAAGWAYSAIGEVVAAHNSSSVSNYSFTDNSTLTGANYYRLKITDFDGRSKYSPVRALNFDAGNTIMVYPNPVKTQLTVTGLKAGQQLRLLGADGRLIMTQTVTGNTSRMYLGGLPKGVYIVEAEGNGTVLSRLKLMKE